MHEVLASKGLDDINLQSAAYESGDKETTTENIHHVFTKVEFSISYVFSS
jgi:hypothetical protein